MKVNVAVETVHQITVDNLKEAMGELMDSFNARSANKVPFSVFEDDREADLAEIQKHIDAMDLVIRYFDEVPS